MDIHLVCSQSFFRDCCAGGCKHANAGACGSAFSSARDMCRIRCRELELAASVVNRLDEEDVQFLNEQDIVQPKPCPIPTGPRAVSRTTGQKFTCQEYPQQRQ